MQPNYYPVYYDYHLGRFYGARYIYEPNEYNYKDDFLCIGEEKPQEKQTSYMYIEKPAQNEESISYEYIPKEQYEQRLVTPSSSYLQLDSVSMISSHKQQEEDFGDLNNQLLIQNEVNVNLKTFFTFEIQLEEIKKVRISRLYFKLKCCNRIVVYRRNKSKKQEFEIQKRQVLPMNNVQQNCLHCRYFKAYIQNFELTTKDSKLIGWCNIDQAEFTIVTVQFACQCQGKWLNKNQDINWKSDSKLASLFCDNCSQLATITLQIKYQKQQIEEPTSLIT